MSAGPILAGVVGWPIEHSLSPLIHTIWAHRAGVEGYYIPLAVAPDYDSFARAMDSLRVIGFAGVNVTLPHKEHALRYADAASDNAKRAGAANMVSFSEAGAGADNSDISGFENALKAQFDAAPKNKRALVLGAGGAARGVVIALKSLGFSTIRIANRTMEKAKKIAAEVGLETVGWSARNEALDDISVLVNTTSLGMTGQPPLEIALDALSGDAIVADIVYTPLQTELLRTAVQYRHRTVDGLSMLAHQAAPGFRRWFGADATIDEALRKALVAELNTRGLA